MSAEINLYLIRHGESVRNTEPDVIGQDKGEILTFNGELQARRLGEYFRDNLISFDEIYFSYYKRARDTCDIACAEFAENAIKYPCVELREYSAGDVTNKKRSEVVTFEVLDEMNKLGMHFKFPKGEALYQVQGRAIKFIYDRILSKPSDKPRNIALFSHGMTIKCILQYVMQFDQKMTWRITLDNTSVSVIQFKNDMWFIKSINDTRHLI